MMSSNTPWRDWIPGVLSASQVEQLCDQGYMTKTEENRSIDHSSMDPHLADEGYLLEGGSIKPSGRGYLHFIEKNKLATRLQPENGIYQLSARKTYLFKVRERLSSTLAEAGIHGQATAKSSIGRLDVLARLVVDGTAGYEGFNPLELRHSNGERFLEITPMTFSVSVREGSSLSQLRLFYGEPRACEIRGRELWNTVLYDPDLGSCGQECNDLLSVDLSDVQIGGLPVAAFEVSDALAKGEVIQLWKDSKRMAPEPYWKFRSADQHDRLRITQNSFYILRSRERLRLPGGLAAYCRAIDETIGEMRIHYAGFVHPFFGWKRFDGKRGTPLIFEVRGLRPQCQLDPSGETRQAYFLQDVN
ncbi:MAG: 2'-deoxycytidine 5'-triphosphate deaminase [Bryobacterales bacterium]|nr:2'-deoxycytidine 5'-triphosphate deaminase [Bryobacterales bacterium]